MNQLLQSFFFAPFSNFLCFNLFKLGFVGRPFSQFLRGKIYQKFFKILSKIAKLPQKVSNFFQFYPRGTSSIPLANQIPFTFCDKYMWLDNFFFHLILKWLLCDCNFCIYWKIYLVKWRKLCLHFTYLMKFLLFTRFCIVKW